MTEEYENITYNLLTDIRDGIRELVGLARTRSASPTSAGPSKPVVAWPADRTIAPDSELDSKYGDPAITTPPRDWTGPFRPGQTMSESEPGLLDLLAERCDYFAQKNDREHNVTDKGVPKSKYDRAKAAKARGWAARLRKGYKRPAVALMDEELPNMGDVPF